MQFRKIDEHKHPLHNFMQEEMSQKGIQIEDFLDQSRQDRGVLA